MELIDIKKYLSDFEIDYLNKVILMTKEPNALSKSMSVLSQYNTLILDGSTESMEKIEKIEEIVMLIKIFSREYEEKGKRADVFEFSEELQSCLEEFTPNSRMGKKAQELLTDSQVNSTWEDVQQEGITREFAEEYEMVHEDTIKILRGIVEKGMQEMSDSDLQKVKKDIGIVEFKHLDEDTISAIAYLVSRKLDYVRKNNIPLGVMCPLNDMNKRVLVALALEYLTRHPIQVIVENDNKNGTEPYDD